MARMVVGLQLDAQLHERISVLKRHVSLQLRLTENSLGLQPTIGLLLDHWEASPPSAEWLAAQAELYPKRGRPRRSEAASLEPRVALRKSISKGHDVVFRRATHGSPHRVYVCKNCSMAYNTYDFHVPPAACPRVAGFSSLFHLHTWKKSELLAFGFEADEVGWAINDEPPETRSPHGGDPGHTSDGPDPLSIGPQDPAAGPPEAGAG